MPKKQDFRAVLRKSGYKATPARLAILTVLHTTRRPMSAEEIIEALPRGRGKGNGATGADQATIYRALRSFKEKGLIAQVDLRHNHAHYEPTDLAEHHHLICLHCGRVEDVHHCGIEDIQPRILRASKHFTEIKQHALEFYGICRSCTAQQAKGK